LLTFYGAAFYRLRFLFIKETMIYLNPMNNPAVSKLLVECGQERKVVDLLVPLPAKAWEMLAHLHSQAGNKSVPAIIETLLTNAYNATTWKDWE
jgi:hypothetical protein